MNVAAILRPTVFLLEKMLNRAKLPSTDTSTDGGLFACYLGLFTSWPGYSQNLDPSQVVEPIFAGYLRVQIHFGPTVLDSTGRISTQAGSVSFAPSDAVNSEGVRGVAIWDAESGGNLLAVGGFPTTFVFARPTDSLACLPTLSFPPTNQADWGNVVGVR